MIDPTSSSTNQLQPQETNVSPEVKDSNEKSQPPKSADTFLQAIPVFSSSQSSLKSQEPVENTQPCTAPSSCEEVVEGKYEYEFSLLYDGCLCFVHLFDTSDVSACERIIHRPINSEEVLYSPATGNGFVQDGEFKYTFTKHPYKRTWTNQIVHTNTVATAQRKHQLTAEDVLSSL